MLWSVGKRELIRLPWTRRISQSWRPVLCSNPTWGHSLGPGWPGLSELEGPLKTRAPAPWLPHTEAEEQSGGAGGTGSHLLRAASDRKQGRGCFHWLKIRKGKHTASRTIPPSHWSQNPKGDCAERGELGVPPFSLSSLLESEIISL